MKYAHGDEVLTTDEQIGVVIGTIQYSEKHVSVEQLASSGIKGGHIHYLVQTKRDGKPHVAYFSEMQLRWPSDRFPKPLL